MAMAFVAVGKSACRAPPALAVGAGLGFSRAMSPPLASSAAAAPVALRLPLPRPLPPVLAVGAFLKTTVTVIRGAEAWVSAAVGDLDTPQAVRRLEATVDALLTEADVRPLAVAHDLHPDFASTRLAQTLGPPALAVQHHAAHLGAVAAEHSLDRPFVGLALDGFGLGPRGESWGGELLAVDGAAWHRLGHLDRLAQPGGDTAARQPWRMGAAALHRLGRGAEIAGRYAGQPQAALLATILDKGLNTPLTSSCGRLFDAACGLLGILPVAAFEGEAPMALESLVGTPRVLDGGWRLGADGRLDLTPLLARLADGLSPEDGADLFHGTLAAALADWVIGAARAQGVADVALGGGCLLNAVLRGDLVARLRAAGLTPRLPRALSPGDPAISTGQAWLAALTIAAKGGPA
jgi:hydrogenase maturation protein HypF